MLVSFSCLILVSAISCSLPRTEEEEADALDIVRRTDSLAAGGGHGFYVATYIIGRYKTSRIKKITFNVEFSRLDKRLVERPIIFRVLDTLTYQLSYSLDSGEIQLVGEFHKVLDNGVLEVLVSPPTNLDSAAYRRVISNYTDSDNELRVYAY